MSHSLETSFSYEFKLDLRGLSTFSAQYLRVTCTVLRLRMASSLSFSTDCALGVETPTTGLLFKTELLYKRLVLASFSSSTKRERIASYRCSLICPCSLWLLRRFWSFQQSLVWQRSQAASTLSSESRWLLKACLIGGARSKYILRVIFQIDAGSEDLNVFRMSDSSFPLGYVTFSWGITHFLALFVLRYQLASSAMLFAPTPSGWNKMAIKELQMKVLVCDFWRQFIYVKQASGILFDRSRTSIKKRQSAELENLFGVRRFCKSNAGSSFLWKRLPIDCCCLVWSMWEFDSWFEQSKSSTIILTVLCYKVSLVFRRIENYIKHPKYSDQTRKSLN